MSVEEFVDGENSTFDTVTIDGRIAYYNIAWYRPRPLIARSNEWISPQVIALRNVEQQDLAGGVRMGQRCSSCALGFQTGFTHMEWYRKSDGEVVFGEIGARPPGAHQVDQMNFACDFDVFREWANAVARGRFDTQIERRYNVATIYKRATGYRAHSCDRRPGGASAPIRLSCRLEHVAADRCPTPQLAPDAGLRRLHHAAPLRISARRSRWPMPSGQICNSMQASSAV